jgi:hypothetical protein
MRVLSDINAVCSCCIGMIGHRLSSLTKCLSFVATLFDIRRSKCLLRSSSSGLHATAGV